MAIIFVISVRFVKLANMFLFPNIYYQSSREWMPVFKYYHEFVDLTATDGEPQNQLLAMWQGKTERWHSSALNGSQLNRV